MSDKDKVKLAKLRLAQLKESRQLHAEPNTSEPATPAQSQDQPADFWDSPPTVAAVSAKVMSWDSPAAKKPGPAPSTQILDIPGLDLDDDEFLDDTIDLGSPDQPELCAQSEQLEQPEPVQESSNPYADCESAVSNVEITEVVEADRQPTEPESVRSESPASQFTDVRFRSASPEGLKTPERRKLPLLDWTRALTGPAHEFKEEAEDFDNLRLGDHNPEPAPKEEPIDEERTMSWGSRQPSAVPETMEIPLSSAAGFTDHDAMTPEFIEQREVNKSSTPESVPLVDAPQPSTALDIPPIPWESSEADGSKSVLDDLTANESMNHAARGAIGETMKTSIDLASLQNEIDALNEQVRRQNGEISELSQKCTALDNENHDLKFKINGLESAQSDQTMAVETLRTSNKSLELANDELQALVDDLKLKIALLEEENVELSEELAHEQAKQTASPEQPDYNDDEPTGSKCQPTPSLAVDLQLSDDFLSEPEAEPLEPEAEPEAAIKNVSGSSDEVVDEIADKPETVLAEPIELGRPQPELASASPGSDAPSTTEPPAEPPAEPEAAPERVSEPQLVSETVPEVLVPEPESVEAAVEPDSTPVNDEATLAAEPTSERAAEPEIPEPSRKSPEWHFNPDSLAVPVPTPLNDPAPLSAPDCKPPAAPEASVHAAEPAPEAAYEGTANSEPAPAAAFWDSAAEVLTQQKSNMSWEPEPVVTPPVPQAPVLDALALELDHQTASDASIPGALDEIISTISDRPGARQAAKPAETEWRPDLRDWLPVGVGARISL